MKSAKKVHTFWQKRAEEIVVESEVTHRDVWQRWLEIETIKKFLQKTMRVIDVGCGNGYTTKQLAPLIREIVGIDYIDEMVKRANEGLESSNISFYQSNVLTLDSAQYGLFDAALSERCLINLDSWESQKRAIQNIIRVLKPNGIFIFNEGLADGRKNLNVLRKKIGLPQMPRVWHNIDFRERELIQYLKRYFIIEQQLYFGVYDFIARVIHPLVVYPKEPQYESKINQIAAYAATYRQDFRDISRSIFLVLKKRH